MFTKLTKAFFLSLILLLFATDAWAQNALERYVQEGLVTNLVLKERQLGLQRGLLGLQSAKRLFMPSVNLSGTYTLAQGGRTIPLPLGDLMNPVYATLNQLTQSQSFPQVENQEVQFLPNNFYDLKVRTTMPIVNSDIIHNRNLQGNAQEMKQAEVDAYELELVKEIKVAYYRLLMALEAEQIYATAETLVAENLRVNERLVANGKGLPAQVLRAEAEREQVLASQAQAHSDVKNARAYFNFLLNRPLEHAVNEEAQPLPQDLLQQLANDPDIQARPELKQLDLALKMNDEALLMERQYWVPRLGAFVDLGSQGFNFAFDDQTMYVMAGLQLDVPLWNGGRDQTDIALRQQTQVELENKLAQAAKGFQVSAFAKRQATLANYQAWLSAARQVTAAETYFRLIDKAYDQGASTMIEHIDARTQLTQAQLLRNIKRYETLISLAEYQREIAVQRP